MNFPADLKYTKDHEWMRIEGDVATIGITDFAQGELGDIVFVEIETNLYMPVAGTIIDVNNALADDPASVNNDPYQSGWMIKVKMDSGADTSHLMDASTYQSSL